MREAVRDGAGARSETASGSWVTCKHDPSAPDHPKGRSEFASCSTGKGNDAGASSNGPHAGIDHQSALAMTYNPRDPGWLSCSDGCCTAGE